MTKTEDLESRMQKIMRSSTHQGQARLRETSKQPHFSGKTRIQTGEIILEYNPAYEQKGRDSEVVIDDITKHEILHTGARIDNVEYRGAPGNAKDSMILMDSIYNVLNPKGYSKRDCYFMENLLTDTLLHMEGSKGIKWDGIIDFYRDCAECDKGKLTELMEAHLKFNTYLWGDADQKRAMNPHYNHSKEAIEVVQNLVKRLGLTKMKRKKDRIREHLMDKDHWGYIARIYAEEMSKLMKPGYAMPTPNDSGAGTNGREDEDDSDEGNEFQKERETDEFRKERIREFFENNQEIPEWMNRPEETRLHNLDLLYQSLAQRMKIMAESKKITANMPLFRYGRREYNPLKDNPRHIKVGRNRLTNEIEFQKAKYEHTIPIPISVRNSGFPKMKICLIDSSYSMLETINGGGKGNSSIIPWGDNSKYHYALLGWYGFLHYMKLNGLLDEKNIELVNFSSQSVHGNGLKNAKENALTPQWGNTYIAPSSVRKIFSGTDQLIFTISDGEIGNWDSIKKAFIEGAKKNHYFHLQIGGYASSTIEMEENGLYVVPVYNAKDIASITVDLTRRVRFE